MKKYFFAFCGILLLIPVDAAVRCVNGGIIEADGDFAPRRIDWEWYQSDPNGARFMGVAVCSDLDPLDNVGTTVNYVTQSAVPSNNIFCYCRLLSPIVSKWTYYSVHDYSECLDKCPENCVYGYHLILEQL